MSIATLEAQLSEANQLLALAEDVIAGLKSGIDIPSRRMEGVFGRERDKVGLRELLHRNDTGGKLGKVVWYDTTSPSFLARILPTNTSPTPTNPSLPAELLYDILSFNDKDSLPNLCLASSVLREIASPLLYKSLSIKSPARLEPFLATPPSPRFAEQRYTFTLDHSIELHLYHTNPRPHSDPLSYPALPLPHVRHIHLHAPNETGHELDELLSSSTRLVAPIDPLYISLNTDVVARFSATFVSPERWEDASSCWRSLQLVVHRGSIAFKGLPRPSERDAMLDEPRVLPWNTIQPTAPSLEFNLPEPDLRALEERAEPDKAIHRLIKTIFNYSQFPDWRSRPSDNLPLLTIRLPTEEDKLRAQKSLEGEDDAILRKAVRFVTGKRKLEGLD